MSLAASGPGARILVLDERDPEHPAAGGAQTHVLRSFSRLVERGYEVTWATSRFDARRESTVAGIRIRRLGRLLTFYPRVAAFTCRRALAGEFDLVVECFNKVPFFTPLYTRAPGLVICHHLFGEVAFQQVAWPIAAAVWSAERLIPAFYRRRPFVAISPSSRDDLVARGIPAEHIAVIPCGVDPPAVAPDLGGEGLVYVGRLEPYKRIDLLLGALARLEPRHAAVRLTLIGRGKDEARLRRVAAELGVAERVHFTGLVDDAARDALLARARICLFASPKEGWGLTVLEANAVGTPVVASDAPGLRDSIRDGVTGILAPEDTADAFAACVTRLLDDDALHGRLARNALDWSRRFDWDRSADALAAVVAQAIARPRDPRPPSLEAGPFGGESGSREVPP